MAADGAGPPDGAIPRVEAGGDGDTLKVVVRDPMDLCPYNGRTVLTRSYPDLWTDTWREPVGDGDSGGDAADDGDVPPIHVRVGTAAHVGDTVGWFIHGANGQYVESTLVERALTDAEVEWCESTFVLSGDSRPETVHQVHLPHPEDIRAAILETHGAGPADGRGDPGSGGRTSDGSGADASGAGRDGRPDLEAVIGDDRQRHRVLTTLQERYEREHLRATNLHWRKGLAVDLLPEWDPDAADKGRRHLYDMAAMRADAHFAGFETAAGFSYRAFRTARARVLDVTEPHLENHDLVALDVAGVPEWTYCRWCGAVGPTDRFLAVERRGSRPDPRTLRVCDDCGDRNPTGIFADGAVARARDRRATAQGGQRRIEGDWCADVSTNRGAGDAE